jgi:FkbM family methyltransferase
MRRRLARNAQRVAQTVGTFDNSATVLRQLIRPGTELTYEIDGLQIAVPNIPGARLPVYEVFADDTYRLAETLAGLGDTPRVLDLGAHIGCFSLGVLRQSPGAVIHAYEPSPATARWLSRNVEHNHPGSVTVWTEAVSDATGTLTVVDNGEVSVHNGMLHAADGGPTVDVPAVTFAQAIDRIGSADVVKLDIEGAEYAIAASGDAEAWAGVQRVVMEYHALPGHAWTELAAFFALAGLFPTRIEPTSEHLGLAWLTRA